MIWPRVAARLRLIARSTAVWFPLIDERIPRGSRTGGSSPRGVEIRA